jgi:hypothetical protein
MHAARPAVCVDQHGVLPAGAARRFQGRERSPRVFLLRLQATMMALGSSAID